MATVSPYWEGLPSAAGEHRSVGRRSWCSTCKTWCYEDSQLQCPCCVAASNDPVREIRVSVLQEWAQAIEDEVGLDAVAHSIREAAQGSR